MSTICFSRERSCAAVSESQDGTNTSTDAASQCTKPPDAIAHLQTRDAFDDCDRDRFCALPSAVKAGALLTVWRVLAKSTILLNVDVVYNASVASTSVFPFQGKEECTHQSASLGS